MNKSEFVSQVAKRGGISTAEAERAVDALFDTSGAGHDAEQGTRTVSIPGFGTFVQTVNRGPHSASAPVVRQIAVTLASGERLVIKSEEEAPRRGIFGPLHALRRGDRPDTEGPEYRAEPMLQSDAASVQEIRDLAVSVWENPRDAEEFLSTPHALLDGRAPLAVAGTAEGAERVREILLALEYGLPV